MQYCEDSPVTKRDRTNLKMNEVLKEDVSFMSMMGKIMFQSSQIVLGRYYSFLMIFHLFLISHCPC